MNRRLYRSVYRVDDIDVPFYAGVPDWLTETNTGSSSSTTVGFDDPSGPGWVASPAGVAFSKSYLMGLPLALDTVKGVEIDATNVTGDGDAEIQLGLSTADFKHHILYVLHPNTSTHAWAGRSFVQVQNGSASSRTQAFIHGIFSTPNTVDLNVGLVVDAVAETVEGNEEASLVRVETNFPAGRTLSLMLLAQSTLEAATPTVRVGRVRVAVYS